jgi:hypothetical protein
MGKEGGQNKLVSFIARFGARRSNLEEPLRGEEQVHVALLYQGLVEIG